MDIQPVNGKQMDSRINVERLCSDNDFMQIMLHSDAYLQTWQCGSHFSSDCNQRNQMFDLWDDLWLYMHAAVIWHNES